MLTRMSLIELERRQQKNDHIASMLAENAYWNGVVLPHWSSLLPWRKSIISELLQWIENAGDPDSLAALAESSGSPAIVSDAFPVVLAAGATPCDANARDATRIHELSVPIVRTRDARRLPGSVCKQHPEVMRGSR